jgi:hypothetical protein
VGCRHFHSLGLETWEGRVEAIILCPHFYAPSPSHRLASFAPILQKNQQNQWLILHSETKIIQHPILWYQVHLTRKPASIWEIFIVVEVEGQIKSDGKKSGIKKTCVLTKVGHRPTDKWILSLDGVWSCLKNSWNPFFLGITWQDLYAWNLLPLKIEKNIHWSNPRRFSAASTLTNFISQTILIISAHICFSRFYKPFIFVSNSTLHQEHMLQTSLQQCKAKQSRGKIQRQCESHPWQVFETKWVTKALVKPTAHVET